MKKLFLINICIILGIMHIIGQAPTGPFVYPTAPNASVNIVAMEYFFDNELPNFGSATPVTGFTSALNVSSFNTNLDLPAAFSAGFHHVFIRTKDISGKWSLTQNAYFDNFMAPAYAAAPNSNKNIKAIEYFFDEENPLPGTANPVAGFTEGLNLANFNTNLTLPNTVLGSFHRLFIRSKDADGRWSLVNNAYFDNYTAPSYSLAPVANTNIVAMEYFFDSENPLPGAGQPLSGFSVGNNISNFNTVATIPNTVTGNFHRFFVRTKDAFGKWSLANNTYFDNFPVPNYALASASPPNINKIEYFFDTDPGAGNGFNVPTIPSNSGNISAFNFDAALGSLQPGNHTIYIRSKQNPFSLANYSTFNKTAPALPINLISFTGKPSVKGNELNWETASEVNNAYFEIERSESENVKFEKIAQITGSNNSNEKMIYSFLDENPNEKSLYRLKQVDYDGKYAYSKIIFVKNEMKAGVSVYPNPFSDKISIENKTNSEFSAELTNVHGKKIKIASNIIEKQFTFSTEDLPKGIYFLKIETKQNTKNIKLVKE